MCQGDYEVALVLAIWVTQFFREIQCYFYNVLVLKGRRPRWNGANPFPD